MQLSADHFDRIDAFLQERLNEARGQLADDSPDAALALDALAYEIARAASMADALRAGAELVRPPSDAWETLRHVARRWQGHPRFLPEFALPAA
ncbi:hypothetical protein [Streptomyces sp. NPDC087538]|uniref:hypothetical protein n=1 Tax=Streptomyces sp. NPDC087538 TaxID=3365797 RepID=UPI00382004D3